jgi:hypothetical protein
MTRPRTPDRKNPNGSTTVHVQRCCNGCGETIGDVTEAEMERAIAGLPPLDVRGECPNCSAVKV